MALADYIYNIADPTEFDFSNLRQAFIDYSVPDGCDGCSESEDCVCMECLIARELEHQY